MSEFSAPTNTNTDTYTFSLGECVVISACSLVAFLMNLALLLKEIQSRQSGKAILTTRPLAICSLCCLISTTLLPLNEALFFLNGYCFIHAWSRTFLALNMGIFMGLFQVARLYYCFSVNRSYTSHAYPSCVFLLMLCVAVFLFISSLIWSSLFVWPSECGWSSHRYYSATYPAHQGLLYSCIYALYFAWDFVTLLLYVFKVTSFSNRYEKENDAINQRILSILFRVLIPTIFYEIVSVTLFALQMSLSETIVDDILVSASSCVYCYAMYLMLEHNQRAYRIFLIVISKLRLNYCCCKWQYVVTTQLREMNANDTVRLKDNTGARQKVVEMELTELSDPTHTDIKIINGKDVMSVASPTHQ